MSGGQPAPEAARSWLRRQLQTNHKALENFLKSSDDLGEEFLDAAFPYRSGPLPAQLGGIASIALLHWAQTTASGLNFLRKVIAGLLRSSQPVPEIWRNLHAGIVDGTITAPIGKKGRRVANERRDELVLLLVTMLQVQFALPRLANRTNRSGESAIEIVESELLASSLEPWLPAPDSIETSLRRRETVRSSEPIVGVIDRQT